MQLKKVLSSLVMGAGLFLGTASMAAAADAPVTAPADAATDASAPAVADPATSEGIPADADEAAEDADTAVEGEEPKK